MLIDRIDKTGRRDSVNVLLVDDEDYVIEGIKKRVNWKALTIDTIFTANNVRQARSYFEREAVDILVCDIRMPLEDGFSLLSWIRKEGIPVQAVFLTSYADFEYAKQAIALGSLEYLLKPIKYEELEEVLKRAVMKVKESRAQKEYEEKSAFWEGSVAHLKEHYWEAAVLGRAQGNEIIKKLGYKPLETFMPVLFIPLSPGGEVWDQNLILFAVKNILEEMLEDKDCFMEAAFTVGEKKIVVVLKALEEEFEADVKKIFVSFIRYLKEQMGQSLWCGIGECEPGDNFNHSVEILEDMFFNTMGGKEKVFLLKEFEKKKTDYEMPPLKLWNKLLSGHEQDALIKEVSRYLKELNQKGKINQEVLFLFRLDMTQLVYGFLTASEVKAHRLFADRECDYLYRQAVFSIYDMERFVGEFVAKALDYIRFTSKSKSVADILSDYIDRNYEKDITRNELAEIVYLNTDYISRLFKKEKGISISSYLMRKRLEAAKELLGKSDMPINGVSLEVGYSNFSYFTKMFRDALGMTPLEYRRMVQEKNK